MGFLFKEEKALDLGSVAPFSLLNLGKSSAEQGNKGVLSGFWQRFIFWEAWGPASTLTAHIFAKTSASISSHQINEAGMASHSNYTRFQVKWVADILLLLGGSVLKTCCLNIMWQESNQLSLKVQFYLQQKPVLNNNEHWQWLRHSSCAQLSFEMVTWDVTVRSLHYKHAHQTLKLSLNSKNKLKSLLFYH